MDPPPTRAPVCLSVDVSQNERIGYTIGAKKTHLSVKDYAFFPYLLKQIAPVAPGTMENEVFSPLLEQFMLTPLVCWVSALINYSNLLQPLSVVTSANTFLRLYWFY